MITVNTNQEAMDCTMNPHIPENSIWQNQKNKRLYIVICTATEVDPSATERVVYFQDGHKHSIYTRPAEAFVEKFRRVQYPEIDNIRRESK